MATNGSRVDPSLIGASGFHFKKEDSRGPKSKLKKIPTQKKLTVTLNGTKDGTASSASSPILPRFEEETMANFPEGRLGGLDTVICKHCKKVILKRTAREHISGCLKSKQEKARKKKEAREAAQRAKERAERGDDDDDEDEDGKKRKTEADDDAPKKRKKKDEPKPKTAKPKGPVDVEKQCGVTLPNGQQCARSLTCKSHSMGAKRAVPGRSQRYDILLANYQKKNQARQQKAAIDANAPLMFEDDLDPSLTGPVDSDEERDSVMTAISRSMGRPQPIITNTLFPTRRKYELVRMKEMLSNALGGNRSGGLFSVPAEPRSAYPPPANNDNFAVPRTTAPSPILSGPGLPTNIIRPPSRKESMEFT